MSDKEILDLFKEILEIFVETGGKIPPQTALHG